MSDAMAVLRQFFGVDEEEALALLELSQWVDQEIAVARHGFPKDNLIPEPMARRLADEGYLRRLLAAARDQEPALAEVVATGLAREGSSRRRRG